MRKLGTRLVSTVFLLLLPTAARAELSIETLAFAVEIFGLNGTDDTFLVGFEVTGTDIATASVTPSGGTTTLLTCSGGTICTAVLDVGGQNALDALLPTTARNYSIALTSAGDPGVTLTDTFSFSRPLLPSPAISEPVAGSVIPPGALTARFLACASCNESTQAALLMAGVVDPIEVASLGASSTSWEPATALAAESEFLVGIAHSIRGSQSLTADGIGPGTDDDSYGFTSSVLHSDAVEFSTGFAPPAGEFCLVVNDDAADAIDPTGCAVLSEPAASILDTSGSCSLVAGGIPIQYELLLAPDGGLSGIADADLDGDATFETHAPLAGRLTGGSGFLRERLRVRFEEPSGTARLAFRLDEQADLASLLAPATPLSWLFEHRLRGKLAGTRIDASAAGLRTQPALPNDPVACTGGPPMTGWQLRFTLTGSDGPSTGSLVLANGSEVALGVRQRFDFLTNQTRLRLASKGVERGVTILIKRLEIDDATDEIETGVVRFRAFGHAARVLVP